MVLSGISLTFVKLSQVRRQITHVLLTLAPLYSFPEGKFLVRLACVRHADSVRSEPGSNSPVIKLKTEKIVLQSTINVGTRKNHLAPFNFKERLKQSPAIYTHHRVSSTKKI